MAKQSANFGEHLRPNEQDIRQGLFFLLGGTALFALGMAFE
jgi:hypothetical protein